MKITYDSTDFAVDILRTEAPITDVNEWSELLWELVEGIASGIGLRTIKGKFAPATNWNLKITTDPGPTGPPRVAESNWTILPGQPPVLEDRVVDGPFDPKLLDVMKELDVFLAHWASEGLLQDLDWREKP